MLAAELAAFKSKPSASPTSAPIPVSGHSQAPSLSSLHISDGAGGIPLYSQSLPSGGLMGHSKFPSKPRVRPTPAPSGLTQLPILELPEPSPHSNSLLNSMSVREEEDASSDDDAGGEGEGEGERPSILMPGAVHGDRPKLSVEGRTNGCSMFGHGESPKQGTFVYAASAPATMLWGPASHRTGGSAMGGRTPSKTLLDAMLRK